MTFDEIHQLKGCRTAGMKESNIEMKEIIKVKEQ